MQRYIKTGIFSFIFVVRLSAADPAPQDAEAQFNLGMAYANGQGVPQDKAKAINWFRKAAEQDNLRAFNWLYEAAQGSNSDYPGNADAQFNLGEMYFNGQGVPQNKAEAINWFLKAAEQGNKDAIDWFRKAAEGGNEHALDWFRKAAEQGNKDAIGWFLKAAEQGNADAQYNLGGMYLNGQGVPEDEAEAINWFRKAADQGHEYAIQWFRISADQGREYAIQWFLKAAKQGNKDAIDWVLRAAQYDNNKDAQFNLGEMYFNGQGVPKDDKQAVDWFRAAANNGNVDALAALRKITEQGGDATAQNILGMLYYQGKGVPKDDVEAANWLSKAADQGNADAQEALGMMYFRGEGVPKDYDKAIALWCKSDLVVAQEQASSDIVIKKIFIGMSIADACKIANNMEPPNMMILEPPNMMILHEMPAYLKPPYRIIKIKNGYKLGTTHYTIYTIFGDAYFVVHADQYGQVDVVFFSAALTNKLFNTADMQPDAFAQEIVNNYGIPSLEPFVETSFGDTVSGWDFSSQQGTRIIVYSSKAIGLRRIPKATDRKFD